MEHRLSKTDTNYQDVLRHLEVVERVGLPSPNSVPPVPTTPAPPSTWTIFHALTTPPPGLPYPHHYPYPPYPTHSPPHTAKASLDSSMIVAVYVGVGAGGLVVLVIFLAGLLYLWRHCRVSESTI